ncbi:MAG: SDR family NAD(P)-dependent oxidoreductase [Novosphingobium sp.]|nr:SDR family NAD(P)-dependent oxidoreductase [Novosphingobium sp.]
MNLQLSGRTALVTGGSNGIGAATARFLAAEGVAVGVHGRHAERTEGVVGEIRASGGAAHALSAELLDEAEVDRLADEALAVLGSVDILVCNAGGRAPLASLGWEESSLANWRATFEMNVHYSVRLIQRLAPAMRARGHGRIVLVSSAAGLQPMGNQPDYGAAKAALMSLAVSTSKWLRGTGVTINAVSPGATLTDQLRGYLMKIAPEKGWGNDWAEIERRAANEMMKIPAGCFGRPEQVASLIGWLASPWASFVTGADIHMDGGVIGTLT